MGVNAGGARSLDFRRGEDVAAEKLNRLVRAIASRVVAQGASIQPMGQGLSIQVQPQRPLVVVPDNFSAIIDTEIGAGAYTWVPNAEGPGEAFVLDDDTCAEYNYSPGITAGTVVFFKREKKLGDSEARWWFFFPVTVCSGGGA